MITPLRAPLVAGTVAALGVSALAAVPAAHSGRLLAAVASPSSAQVALAAFVNPVVELLFTGEQAQNYLFGAYYNGSDSPTPGAGEANWPYAGFDQTGGGLLNYALYVEPALGYYSYVGLWPNSTANASPVLRQLQTNWSDYINVGLTGLTTATAVLSQGVWDFPSAVLTAAQLALGGQISEALAVLTDAVVVPVTIAGYALLDAGIYVASNVAARLGAVVAALPQILTTFAGAAVGGAVVLAGKSAAIATEWVSQLASLNFEAAWNTAVAGLLGPSGLPGTVLNLTTGAGVQTGPILTTADIAGNFVPSVRTAYQAAVWTTANALSTSPAPSAAAPAPSAAGARTAAAVGAASAASTVATASAADSASPATAGGDATATAAPVKAAAAGRGAATRERADRAPAAED